MNNIEDNFGYSVFVNELIVAWFLEFNEEAQQFCTENYFGKWLVFKAEKPKIIPLSPEELFKIENRAKELAAIFNDD